MMYKKITSLLIFLSIFIVSTNCSKAQSNDLLWWKTFYKEGILRLNEGQLEEAEILFKQILEQDKKVPEAYYGLGLVYDKKKPGSYRARRNFEKSIKLNKDFIPAYSKLASIYEQRKEAIRARRYLEIALKKDPNLVDEWIRLAKIQESFKDINAAINVYSKAIRHNPNSMNLYSEFIKTALFYDKEDKALSILNDLVQKYPEEPSYLLDLANIYFHLDKYEETLNLLNNLKVSFPNYSLCQTLLLRAKIYFDIGEIDEGLIDYWSAIYSIKDSSDADVFYNDTYYLMKDFEYNKLQITPIDRLSDFYLLFWQFRDPDPATTENERIVEHFKRVSYARKNYRRYTTDINNVEIPYELIHPYSDINVQGEKLLEWANFPKALQRERDLDDFGLMYVRHGESDQQVFSETGMPTYVFDEITEHLVESHMLRSGDSLSVRPEENPTNKYRSYNSMRMPQPHMGETLYSPGFVNNMPDNISVRYERRSNRPEMIFHFKKFGSQAGWIIEAIPYAVAEREVFSAQYSRLGMESFSSYPNSAIIAESCIRLVQENIEHVNVGLQTETSYFRIQK